MTINQKTLFSHTSSHFSQPAPGLSSELTSSQLPPLHLTGVQYV